MMIIISNRATVFCLICCNFSLISRLCMRLCMILCIRIWKLDPYFSPRISVFMSIHEESRYTCCTWWKCVHTFMYTYIRWCTVHGCVTFLKWLFIAVLSSTPLNSLFFKRSFSWLHSFIQCSWLSDGAHIFA